MSLNLNHTKALVTKFGLMSVLLSATLPWAGYWPWRHLAVAAAVLTVSLYMSGDLYIFPHLGNLVASVGDGFMAAFLLYGLQFVLPGSRVGLGQSLATGVLVGVVEFFYHQFLKRLDVVANEAPQVMPKTWERALGHWVAGGDHPPEPKEDPAPNPEYLGMERP